VLVFHVAIYFLNYGIHEFLRIWLSEGLIEIHDVSHHLGMEPDRVPHALLKFNVRVVE
jgi:hypothetical protein